MPFKLHFFKSQPVSGSGRRKLSYPMLLVGFLVVTVTSYLLYTPEPETLSQMELKAGDIVTENITIQKTVTVEDKESTEEKRKEARENVVPVYEYYPDRQFRSRNLISTWFQLIREARPDYIKNGKHKEDLERIRERIAAQLGMDFTPVEVRRILLSQFFHKVDLNRLFSFISQLYSKKITASLIGAQQGKDGTIQLVSKTGDADGEFRVIDIGEVSDLKLAREELTRFVRDQKLTSSTESANFCAGILGQFIDINISYSAVLTKEESEKAVAEVIPVIIKFKKGRVILRTGDEVGAGDIKTLKLIRTQEEISQQTLSDFYLIFAVMAFLAVYGGRFFKKWSMGGINREKLFAVMGSTLLLSAVLYRISLFLFPLILSNINIDIQYDLQSIFYALPFGAGALSIAFVFNLRGAVIYSFVNALIGAVICNWDFTIFLYVLLGNLAVSYGIEHYQRLKRSPIIKAAILWQLPVNMATIALFHLTRGDFDLMHLSVSIFMGIFAAVLSPVLANFIIPVWEMFFGLVTDLKLIELTNLNLPIFREMLEKAPGTYHHSQMVASLSEAAAQDLQISPLLQRAMALYHDIGKIDNPHFFTENHAIYRNPHPEMPPRESAKNITAHITDGMERAEKLKLPSTVSSSIMEHHGTKRVHYFYDKAMEMSSVATDGIDDNVFRYHGSKPKDIENAIIMLADQVEAASKSLAAPTDEEIKNVISKIIDSNMEEGQFDQCEGLTFKALNIIANSFFKKLSAIYHMRISYPRFDFKEKQKDKDTTEEQGKVRDGTDRFKIGT